MRAATAQNINNMKMGPILRHTTLFPPHPGIEFSPWKRVNSANMSLQNLYYEISCYFRNGQNFHISTYLYHFVPLAKFTLGYRLQLLITFLTIFKRYIGIFWKIRKALSNPNLPLKSSFNTNQKQPKERIAGKGRGFECGLSNYFESQLF